MDIYVYDSNFVVQCILDTYQSLLWTDRYNKPGEFEIYTPVTQRLVDNLVEGNLISIKDSDYMMIIEKRQIKTDTEEGPIIVVKGRSLESILDRRIIWQTTNISGNLQNGIKTLINQNLVSPSIADRRIDNFVFEDSTDTAITSLTWEAQYTGDNLLEVIENICKEKGIGFRVWLNDNNQFVFKLYAGVDRSYSQDTIPWVIFSPRYENLINSDYLEDNEKFKNVALVAGEGENQQRVTRVVGNGSGLTRKELYVDARDLQSTDITTQQYYNNLDTRGKEKLAEHKVLKEFESECEVTRQFVYKEHFWLGDIVQVENQYGIGSSARVTEFIYADETDELKRYPTFEFIEEET